MPAERSIKLSGFTLVRNGIEFDYPFLESIRSLLPLVDELIINVGKSTDATWTKILELKGEPGGSKIDAFESEWPLDDPEQKLGGIILSTQTNLALDRCTGDWCIYLQADEVLYEEDYSTLKSALISADARSDVDGLLFDYIHFYGSFDVVQSTRSAYRREVRAFRRSSGARSVGDAQSFRRADQSKLVVVESGARIFHYGWVRSPQAMKEKTEFMDSLYHGGVTRQDGSPVTGDNYRYKKFWGLRPFAGNHPGTMQERISKKGWHWDLDRSKFVWEWKDLVKISLDLFERSTGHRLFEYRSYKLIK